MCDSYGINQSGRLSSAFAIPQSVNKHVCRERKLTVLPRDHLQHCHDYPPQGFLSDDSEGFPSEDSGPHHVKRDQNGYSSEDSGSHSMKRDRNSYSSEDSEPHSVNRGWTGSSSEDSNLHSVKIGRQGCSYEGSDSSDYRVIWLGKLRSSPWSGPSVLQPGWRINRTLLGRINTKGFLTINIQPAVNRESTCSPSVGWGGYVYQKAHVEFFCSKVKLDALVDTCKALRSISNLLCNEEIWELDIEWRSRKCEFGKMGSLPKGDNRTDCPEPIWQFYCSE